MFIVDVKLCHMRSCLQTSYTQNVGTQKKKLKKIIADIWQSKNYMSQNLIPCWLKQAVTSDWSRFYFASERVPNIKLMKVELRWDLRGAPLSTRRSGALRSPSPPCGEARGDPSRRSWGCRSHLEASRRHSRSPGVDDLGVCRRSPV